MALAAGKVLPSACVGNKIGADEEEADGDAAAVVVAVAVAVAVVAVAARLE